MFVHLISLEDKCISPSLHLFTLSRHSHGEKGDGEGRGGGVIQQKESDDKEQRPKGEIDLERGSRLTKKEGKVLNFEMPRAESWLEPFVFIFRRAEERGFESVLSFELVFALFRNPTCTID